MFRLVRKINLILDLAVGAEGSLEISSQIISAKLQVFFIMPDAMQTFSSHIPQNRCTLPVNTAKYAIAVPEDIGLLHEPVAVVG